MGLEHPNAVCGGDGPKCVYEDRVQDRVDREFAYERQLRLAVLDDLTRRIHLGLERLDEGRSIVESADVDERGALQVDNVELQGLLSGALMDLRPASFEDLDERRRSLLRPLLSVPCDGHVYDHEGNRWEMCDRGLAAAGPGSQRARLLARIDAERDRLLRLDTQLQALQARDAWGELAESGEDRQELIDDLASSADSEFHERLTIAGWLAAGPADDGGFYDTASKLAKVDEGLAGISAAMASSARTDVGDLFTAVTRPEAKIWAGGWVDGERSVIEKPSIRYRSPMTASQQWQLFGTCLFSLAGIMLVIVGPVVTATSTAREREAGTLPVLRMTGLSAGDLALAMTIGPNVFALVAGGALLAASLPILAVTAGPGALVLPLGIVLGLSAATHLTAIGLGDALGHRVNAMVVGGLLALGLLGPGLVGTTLVLGDVAATGFLLGPVPATLATITGLSGIPYLEMAAQGGSGELGRTMLGYAVVVQGALGMLCLLSWRRRVEQGWAPLFKPFEGAALALASVGCSALAVLDLSERIHVQTYDHVNSITFIATAFLMPVLGWLLVSSLVRPARAASVASVEEVRRGFWRFQAFIAFTAFALATAYSVVLDRSGLGSEASEVMWATIAQGVLVAESAAATLLWASRRREGRHRVLLLGGAVVVLQLLLTIGVYNLEVEHVALTQTSGTPLLIGMEASPYWLAFLVLLWAAGLGLILAALLRERDRAAADEDGSRVDDDEERGRWLH